jgi:putative oxidoreductase
MITRITPAVRILMGLIYTINGLNWWVKLITPYPSISDFAHMAPPPDVVGALIQTHVMFHMVKGLELLTGLALLSDTLVPLMLVAVVPVTLSAFIVDVFFIARLRGVVMGAGSLLLNGYLLLAYCDHYRAMLAWRGQVAPATDPATAPGLGPVVAALSDALRPVLGPVALAAGLVMLGWLLALVGAYILHPLPLSAVLPHHP